MACSERKDCPCALASVVELPSLQPSRVNQLDRDPVGAEAVYEIILRRTRFRTDQGPRRTSESIEETTLANIRGTDQDRTEGSGCQRTVLEPLQRCLYQRDRCPDFPEQNGFRYEREIFFGKVQPGFDFRQQLEELVARRRSGCV